MNAECKPSGYISMPNCRPFLPSALYAIHKPKPMDGWTDGRTNAWNDNNTHRHQCSPRVSHLETSAFLTLCHSFPVTCQQMCKNLKMWLTDLLTDKRTDRRTDKRVARGHYCWGVCDKKWKFKNVEKITSFSDAVTLTFDLEKLIRSGHYHYQCVYQIWEQSIPWFLSYRVNTIAGGGRLRRKTITSPDPLDTGDIIIIFR